MKVLTSNSPCIAHGVGLFETMLVVRGQVFHLDEHFRRLADSADTLHFPPPGKRAFCTAVARAARQFQSLEEGALRCLYVAAGADLDDPASWRIIATVAPVPATTLRRRKGARVITLDRSLLRALPEHKLTSYAASVVGLRAAVAAGADEGFLLDHRGHILEGTATNVFAIAGSTLITAPVKAGILPGIVRARVLDNAKRLGLVVVERPPTIDQLHGGSFLTSSLTKLAPIVRINGIACSRPGRGFRQLRRRYANELRRNAT